MKVVFQSFACALIMALAMGCSTAPKTADERSALHHDVAAAIGNFKAQDPTVQRFFDSSVGYAVFPSVGKGGALLGGAYGRGELFENGVFTSYCDLSQGTIGLQLGGQSYSEIIFFESTDALNDFKEGDVAFAAQASAVAAKAGAAANAKYTDGVAVFTADYGGLMAEASIGGQKFSVVPNSDASFAADDRSGNVYGYARTDEWDGSWRAGSPYNMQYDPQKAMTIEGEVISVSEFSPANNASKGRELTVRTNDDRIYIVHLGPRVHMDRLETQDAKNRIQNGDRITLTGSTCVINGSEVMLAQQVTTRESRTLELRDAQGRPRW